MNFKSKTRISIRLGSQALAFVLSFFLTSMGFCDQIKTTHQDGPELVGELRPTSESIQNDVVNMNGVAQAKSLIQASNGDLVFSSDDGAKALATAKVADKVYANANKHNPVTVASAQQKRAPLSNSIITAANDLRHAMNNSKKVIFDKHYVVTSHQYAQNLNEDQYPVLTKMEPLLNKAEQPDIQMLFASMMTLVLISLYGRNLQTQKRINAKHRSFAFNARMALHDILGFAQLLQEERAGNISSVRKQYLSEIVAESKEILSNLNSLEKHNLSDRDLSFNLRTELFSIIGFAQLFSSEKLGTLTTKQKEFIGEVIHESDSILNLVS